METNSQVSSNQPEFDTSATIPDGFALSLILIFLVLGVSCVVILRPLREKILQFFFARKKNSLEGKTVKGIRLSPQTTLYRINFDQKQVFVVESSLNTSITVKDEASELGNIGSENHSYD